MGKLSFTRYLNNLTGSLLHFLAQRYAKDCLISRSLHESHHPDPCHEGGKFEELEPLGNQVHERGPSFGRLIRPDPHGLLLIGLSPRSCHIGCNPTRSQAS